LPLSQVCVAFSSWGLGDGRTTVRRYRDVSNPFWFTH
jgi:hypothetical protein